MQRWQAKPLSLCRNPARPPTWPQGGGAYPIPAEAGRGERWQRAPSKKSKKGASKKSDHRARGLALSAESKDLT